MTQPRRRKKPPIHILCVKSTPVVVLEATTITMTTMARRRRQTPIHIHMETTPAVPEVIIINITTTMWKTMIRQNRTSRERSNFLVA